MDEKHVELINTMNKFNTLKNTPGKKDKEALIEEYKNDILFLEILKFLCDKDKVTGIARKKLNKEIVPEVGQFYMTIKDVSSLINTVCLNNTGNDIMIKTVQDSINTFPEETHEFLKEIITKKYKCGVTAKTLNKVIPDCVSTFNVMLAESYKKHSKKLENKRFVLTVKLDGFRCVCIVYENGTVVFKTRQGKVITGLIDLEKEAVKLPPGVYDGELIADGYFADSQDQYKETSKRATIKGDKTGLVMKCYDYIEDINNFKAGFDPTPYIERKNKLRDILRSYDIDSQDITNNFKYFLYLDNLYEGDDIEEIPGFFEAAVTLGEEGLMINIADAPYECKRTTNLLKYKEFQTADVLITNIIEGQGKYKGQVGSFTAECIVNIDGVNYPCISDVGSGLTDEQRKLYWEQPELVLNKIVEIEFFKVTQNEDGDYSLRFATWKDRIRQDKTATNID